MAAEIGVMDLGLAREVLDQVKERAPTHAAFIESSGYVSFFHDQFLNYALAHRVALYLRTEKEDSLARLLLPRTLPPDAVQWTAWSFRQFSGRLETAMSVANRVAAKGFGSMAQAENFGLLAAAIAAGETQPLEMTGQRFYGESLQDQRYSSVTFKSCSFWEADLCNAEFAACSFVDCEFGSIRINKATSLRGSKFLGCKFAGLQIDDSASAYSPSDIERVIRQKGGVVDLAGTTATPVAKRTGEAVIDLIEEIVRRSERTCDVALEDIEEASPFLAGKVLRAAERTGVMKKTTRTTSGPKKTFFRFQVDRNQVMRGQGAIVDEPSINDFWRELAEKLPG